MARQRQVLDVDPFQMPVRRRRTDGFSDDGLSYSVADDFSKLAGQAMAEYDARIKDPRFVPGGITPNPDSPELLEQELFEPLRQRFGTPRAGRSVAPKTFEIGNDLVSLDPMTGRTNVVYSAPPKAEPDLTPRERVMISSAADKVKQLRSAFERRSANPPEIPDANYYRSLRKAQTDLMAAEDALGQFGRSPDTAPEATVAAPQAPLWPGGNIIGDETNNAFGQPSRGSPPPVRRVGRFNVTPR